MNAKCKWRYGRSAAREGAASKERRRERIGGRVSNPRRMPGREGMGLGPSGVLTEQRSSHTAQSESEIHLGPH